MSDFDHFIARHGESAAQAILENIERFHGISHHATLSLETRWQRVMNDAPAADAPSYALAA